MHNTRHLDILQFASVNRPHEGNTIKSHYRCTVRHCERFLQLLMETSRYYYALLCINNFFTELTYSHHVLFPFGELGFEGNDESGFNFLMRMSL